MRAAGSPQGPLTELTGAVHPGIFELAIRAGVPNGLATELGRLYTGEQGAAAFALLLDLMAKQEKQDRLRWLYRNLLNLLRRPSQQPRE
jgi:hypothetical protein